MHRSLVIVLCTVVIAGCQKPPAQRTPVARIDNRTLTLEEIEARFDSARGISQAQVHEYIQRWLISELLYQEAVRRGFDQSQDLERRLADIRRQMAINALLEQEIYNARTQQSTTQEVKGFFESNRSDFLLPRDIALISFVMFRDRDAAGIFRSRLLRGTSWNEAVKQVSADAQLASQVITRVDSAYYSEVTLFPAEVWRAVVSAARQEPTFPVRTADGYYVLYVWRYSRRGDTPDLGYVRNEIESRLAIGRRQKAMDSLLENLRAKHVVQILVSSVPQDSVSLKIRE